MAGEVGDGFALQAAHHQGLEPGQFLRRQGLIVAQIKVQPAKIQDVGQDTSAEARGSETPLSRK